MTEEIEEERHSLFYITMTDSEKEYFGDRFPDYFTNRLPDLSKGAYERDAIVWKRDTSI